MDTSTYKNFRTIKRLKFYANTQLNETNLDIDVPLGTAGKIVENLEGDWYRVVLKIQQPDLTYKAISSSVHASTITLIDENDKEVRRPIEEIYITTVQLAFKIEDDQAPEDYISEVLSNIGLIDWAYLKLGGQYLYPTLRYVPKDQEEGEIFE